MNLVLIKTKELKIYERAVIIRGGVDKFLDRPTSRCRRTESIVSFSLALPGCT